MLIDRVCNTEGMETTFDVTFITDSAMSANGYERVG